LLKASTIARLQKLLGLWTALILLGSGASALDGHVRTLSIDSGYLTSANSNRAFSALGVEWVDAQSFLFDKLHFTDSALGNGLTLIAGSAAGFTLSVDGFMTPYHEFGHFSRAYAVGLDPQFDPAASNFIGFLSKRFVNIFGDASVQFRHGDRRFIPPVDSRYVASGPFAFTPSSEQSLSTDWGVVFHSAGVNNEMRFAGDLADRLLDGHGHVYEWVPYTAGLLSSNYYNLTNDTPNNSDLHSLSRIYGNKGLSISVPDMERANMISFVGSAATWAYMKGIWDFVGKGETRVNAFSVKGVYLPIVTNYLTSQGISFRAASAYRLNEKVLFPFAIEFIGMSGGSGQEYTLGYRQSDLLLPGLSPSVAATFGRGLNLNASLSYDATRFTRVSIGIEKYDVDSFHGERNITSVEKRQDAAQAWGRVSLLY